MFQCLTPGPVLRIPVLSNTLGPVTFFPAPGPVGLLPVPPGSRFVPPDMVTAWLPVGVVKGRPKPGIGRGEAADFIMESSFLGAPTPALGASRLVAPFLAAVLGGGRSGRSPRFLTPSPPDRGCKERVAGGGGPVKGIPARNPD